MKNKIIMLICATLLVGTLSAQKITADKIPAAITSAFKSKYPGATNTSWSMQGKNYKADFKVNAAHETALFNSSGGWIKTDTDISAVELPEAVRQTITKQFAGYNIQEASRMENSDHGNGYEVALEKGKEKKDVVLSSKGTVISQEPRKMDTVKTN
jgi:hypothetical protein